MPLAHAPAISRPQPPRRHGLKGFDGPPDLASARRFAPAGLLSEKTRLLFRRKNRHAPRSRRGAFSFLRCIGVFPPWACHRTAPELPAEPLTNAARRTAAPGGMGEITLSRAALIDVY